jgi:zinc transport system substrate-binding protein
VSSIISVKDYAKRYHPMNKRFVVVALLVLVTALLGFPVSGQDASPGKIQVVVGILPVAYFVERVGGPHVDVSVLVGPGQDPHTFEPTPRLVTKLADARVLFELGFPFEENLVKKTGSMFKNVEVVNLQKGIRLRAMTEEEEHGHGHGEEHESGELDQHTWLDPQLAKIQARTIADTFIRIDPTHQTEYERNLRDFHADLDAIHEQLTKALAPVKGKTFLVFHPAYGYFGDAYGLKQVAVQLEGKEPTARQLARLVDLAKKDGVRIIFVQPQFSKKSAQAVAEAISGAVVPLDDLSPDYLKNLQDMAAKVSTALQPQRK